MKTAIRIMVVEDQAMVLDAISTLLNMEEDIEVCSTARDGIEALENLQTEAIDVLVTDIEMPNMDGLSLCHQVKQQFASVRTLLMTTYNRSGYVRRALDGGVDGFILKECPVEELASAIREVHNGKRYYDPELIVAGLSDNNPLTERERDVLRLVAKGLTSGAIAEKLFLSTGTVRNYLSEAMNKLHVSNRSAAASKAEESGWL